MAENGDMDNTVQVIEIEMGASTTIAAGIQQRPNIQQQINKTTKWLVSFSVAGVLLYRRDNHTLWAITGAIANAGFSKLLKRCINQERPLTASGIKIDPGMPSSHAQSLGFLGTYAALGFLSWESLGFWCFILAIAVCCVAVYMAWLRIRDGLHTPAQVGVGAGIGSIAAFLWHWIWITYYSNALLIHWWAFPTLIVAFGVSSLVFGVHVITKWRLGDL